jgi:hypothetical protein
MKSNLLKSGLFVLLLSQGGCIESFSPPETISTDKFLVVDGFLNASNDTSVIELRHSQNTNNNEAYTVESGAELTVESDGGALYSFTEEGEGRYILPPVHVATTDKYRLRIRRVSGKEYLSEYVNVSVTPPIDSINYRFDAGRNAMVIRVNSHDKTGQTRFYRWKYEETYQYRAPYYSLLVYDPIEEYFESRREDINLCWASKKSNSIILGSTVKLTSDVIKDLPVNVVGISTNKLFIKYSILVKQYGLSKEEFEYWTSLSKTTQGTGSLFDPQPSQVTGNVRNVKDSKELVFGFFSVAKEEKMRIFMTPGLGYFPRCEPPDTISVEDYKQNPAGYVLNLHGIELDTVIRSNYGCVDCRAQGGTLERPSFWQ